MTSAKLVLLAHGSKRDSWKEPFVKLQSDLEEVLGKDQVLLAYLEKNRPSLAEVILEEKENTSFFYLWPIFLSFGSHIGRDIPERIRDLEQTEGVTIHLLPHLGGLPEFWKFLVPLGAKLLKEKRCLEEDCWKEES